MSVDNFIPQLWEAKYLETLKKIHVFAGVANREYEGTIRQYGDSVRIPTIAALSASAYTKNSTSITVSDLNDGVSVLNIDRSYYTAFGVDSVDLAQAKGNLMNAGMIEAAYALSDNVDAYMASLYGDAGMSQNTNASPVDMTSLNVEEEFLTAAETMDENNVPREGRFAIIPPWVHNKFALAAITTLTDNLDEWKNGRVGTFGGFDLRMSNNVSKNSTSWDQTRVICGIKGKSFTLAEQLTDVIAYKPESSFEDAVKMLLLYGAKIIRPDMTLTLYADKTAEA